jgi:putative membrane protein insertion efficiency factor
MLKSIPLIFIKFYQKFLTVLSFGSCRYYPTCSEYAKWQFEKNSFFMATLFSIKRISSCHQLSKGGFDYPIISKKVFLKSQTKIIYSEKIDIKYYYIPHKNRYIMIQNFTRKTNNG